MSYKLSLLIVIILSLFSISQSAISSPSHILLYQITNECLECLRNLGIFSEKSLSILQTKRYASLETVKEMALKQYRLLSVENEDSNSYAILQCLNGEEVTFKVNSHHEETLLNQIGAMESECSDELLSTFKVDLVKWRRDVCYKKSYKTKGCFPDVLETNVREYFDEICELVVGYKVFSVKDEQEAAY